MLNYSIDALLLTSQFEGCRLCAYQDSAGVWTILPLLPAPCRPMLRCPT